MKFKKFLIANGNPTLLVWNCEKGERNKFISNYLGVVDQVGFVNTEEKGKVTLSMMGNELCINALLALSSTLEPDVKLYIEANDQKISFTNNDDFVRVTIALPYMRKGNIVTLDGIGYLATNKKEDITKEKASDLAQKYKVPAFGMLLYENNTIFPYIYVKKTNSFIQESACGSGSIAFNIFCNETEVKQPTGEYIRVKRNDQCFIIAARVTNLNSLV